MTDAANAAQHAAGDRAIESFHLTRRFGAFTAVDRVNLVVPYGGIFGLLQAVIIYLIAIAMHISLRTEPAAVVLGAVFVVFVVIAARLYPTLIE